MVENLERTSVIKMEDRTKLKEAILSWAKNPQVRFLVDAESPQQMLAWLSTFLPTDFSLTLLDNAVSIEHGLARQHGFHYRMRDVTCQECAFARHRHRDVFHCHLNPPALDRDTSDCVSWEFPIVFMTTPGCSHFQPKTRASSK